MPSYAHPGDAGLDLFTLAEVKIEPGQIGQIRSGVAMAIPEGYVGLCWDKSGLSHKFGLKVLGGVIDAGFRGELVLSLINLGRASYTFAKHDKVMQLLIQPVARMEVEETDTLSDTSRGHGGWGSTGK